MNAYLQALKALYQQQTNPDNAGPMKKYMGGQFEFLGIKTPAAKALFKVAIAQNSRLNHAVVVVNAPLSQGQGRSHGQS